MNKSKWITMAAVMTFSASLAVAAPHRGGGEGKRHGRKGGEFSQRFAQKLNLTDAQQQQIRAIQQSFKQRHEAFFESAKETRRQLREAKQANDTARLESLKPALEAQRAQFQQIRQEKQQQILAVLTPEQRAQYESLKAQRQERRGNRNRK